MIEQLIIIVVVVFGWIALIQIGKMQCNCNDYLQTIMQQLRSIIFHAYMLKS